MRADLQNSVRSGPNCRGQNGFSLIEMLVVLALLVALSTMYWGSNSASRQKELKASCQKNLQKMSVALDIFANDHGTMYPQVLGARTSEDALDVLVPQYTADTAIFICPGSKNSALSPGQPLRQGRISYAYYMGRSSKDGPEPLVSDKQVDTSAKATGQLIFSTTGKPPGNNHHEYGGNVLFLDGRVEPSPAHASVPLGLTPTVTLLNPK